MSIFKLIKPIIKWAPHSSMFGSPCAQGFAHEFGQSKSTWFKWSMHTHKRQKKILIILYKIFSLSKLFFLIPEPKRKFRHVLWPSLGAVLPRWTMHKLAKKNPRSPSLHKVRKSFPIKLWTKLNSLSFTFML